MLNRSNFLTLMNGGGTEKKKKQKKKNKKKQTSDSKILLTNIHYNFHLQWLII